MDSQINDQQAYIEEMVQKKKKKKKKTVRCSGKEVA
jgi:hypothetical protein